MHPMRFGRLTLALAVSALALTACSKKTEEAASATVNASDNVAATVENVVTPPTTPAGGVAADNVDTVDGSKLASFTGDAAKGDIIFLQCKTCHEFTKNKIGPHLHALIDRKAGAVADFNYSDANKNSGITWTEDKLFQYLEKPQRVVPGTKMTYAGVADPQKRADLIAYLKAN